MVKVMLGAFVLVGLFAPLSIAECVAASDPTLISLDAKKLPKGFRGYSHRKLLSKAKYLKSKLPTKGEFETTADFENRLDEANIRLTEQIPIPLVFAGKNVSFDYDADTGLSKVFIVDDLQYDYQGVIGLEKSQHENGTYSGRNSYGADTQVTKLYYYELWLNYDDDRYMLAEKSAGDIYNRSLLNLKSIKITSSVQTAKRIMDGASLVYFIRLKPKYKQDGSSDAPTFDNPYDSVQSIDIIFGEIVQVWLFSQKTGEIYAKFVVKEHMDKLKERYKNNLNCRSCAPVTLQTELE